MDNSNHKNEGVNQFETKSGKMVYVHFITDKMYGVYLNRNNEWAATSWNLNGQWMDKFESSMDIVL